MLKMMIKKIVIAILLLVGIFQNSQAQVRPSIEWKKIVTPHFEILFDASHPLTAQHYANRLEIAYAQLKPSFSMAPQHWVVVLNDRTDLTNGYVTAIPYGIMMLYPAPPESTGTLSEYDDWEQNLVTHELTHAFSMNNVMEPFRTLRSIFGTIVTPNMFLPRWWLEGVAVYTETRLSQKGRLRSAYQDASIRAWVIDEKWLSVNFPEINEVSLSTWPYGARPYIFGSLMWAEMIAQKGDQTIKDLHDKYGGRIPFVINTPFEHYFQKDHEQMFDAVKNKMQMRVQKQIEELSKVPPSPWEKLDLPEKEQFLPQVSPDGLKLAYIAKDQNNKMSLVIRIRKSLDSLFKDSEAESQKVESLYDSPESGMLGSLNWFADSDRIVYDKIETINRFQEFSDLYIYSLKDQKKDRLTKGIRGREPIPSADQQKIAFIRLEAGETHLSILDLKNRQVKKLYSAPIGERLASPSFIDDHKIMFTLRNNKAEESLRIYNLEMNQLENTPEDNLKTITQPFLSQGRLFFISSQSGLFNLYESKSFFKPDCFVCDIQPRTHSLTGVVSATYDPLGKNIFASVMTGEGPKLMRLSEDKFLKDESLPKVEPLWKQEIPTTELQVETQKYPIEKYSSLSYLWPHYWLPFVSYSDQGLFLQVSTSGQDPLQKHSYEISASWDSYINKGSWIFNYINNNYEPQLQFTTQEFNSYLINNEVPISDELTEVDATWPITFWNKKLGTSIGWTYKSRSILKYKIRQVGPLFRLRYGEVEQTSAQISPEKGHVGEIYYRSFLKDMSDLSYQQVFARGRVYLQKFLPTHHVFYSGLNLLYTDKELSKYYAVRTQMSSITTDEFSLPMRGYMSSQFLGSQIANLNLEYRFPLKDLNTGFGIFPLFFKKLHGSFISDHILLNGYVYNSFTENFGIENNAHLYSSVGLEMMVDTTIGYNLPMTFLLGLYNPLNRQVSSSNTFFFGLKL
jgi:hypothetical protein